MLDVDRDTWHETVVLPVGSVDDAGAELREVTLRKMTGNEEALLAEPRLRNNGGKLITALLTSCTRDRDFQPLGPAAIRHLSSADRNFLLLELRRLTFGDEMEAHYACPRCGETNSVLEDLGEIDVRRSEGDLDGQQVTVQLADGYHDGDRGWQREMSFALPTGEDEEAASSRNDSNPARQRDALLARCLRRVGEMEPKRIRALGTRLLAELSMEDRRRIHGALDAAGPGPDLTRSIACGRCGNEFRTTLDMTQFFPLA
jgi:hypothetical protein